MITIDKILLTDEVGHLAAREMEWVEQGLRLVLSL